MTQNPLFAALLTPHRSLGPKGVRAVVAMTALFALIPGLVFFAMGAWPVVGFLGLEVLALYWALSHSLKGANAYEEITLWPDALDIVHVSAGGEQARQSFNPFYVKFLPQRDHEGNITALTLMGEGRIVEIGRFLNDDDKARFATGFGPALSRAKR